MNINKSGDKNKIRSHEYVIGDIHGCFDEFKELVNKINDVDPKAQFILVGDIIDRGSQSIEMIDWAMQNVNKEGSRFKMILGNHEYDKIEVLDAYLNSDDRYIYYNDHYRFTNLIRDYGLSSEQILKIKDFFSTLPVYYETNANLRLTNGKIRKQHYIIVHGGASDFVNKDGTFKRSALSSRAIDESKMLYGSSPAERIVWERNYFGNPYIGSSIIVHGHSPTIMRDLVVRGATRGRIDYRSHDINVDCGLVYRDKWERCANLAAICLDNLEEYYLYDYPEDLVGNLEIPYYKSEMLGKRYRRRNVDFDDLDLDEIFKE